MSSYEERRYNACIISRIDAAIAALRAGKKSAFSVFAGFSAGSPENRLASQRRNWYDITGEEFAQWKATYEKLTIEEKKEPWGDPLGDD